MNFRRQIHDAREVCTTQVREIVQIYSLIETCLKICKTNNMGDDRVHGYGEEKEEKRPELNRTQRSGRQAVEDTLPLTASVDGDVDIGIYPNR